jgi:hypothetical protein
LPWLKAPTPQGAKFLRAILGCAAFSIFLDAVWSYFAVSGLVHMESARAILIFAWLIGTVGIVVSDRVWAKQFVHRVRLSFAASILLAVLLLGLDAWTIRHRPSEVHPIAWADFPASLANRIADAVYNRIAPLFREQLAKPDNNSNSSPVPKETPPKPPVKPDIGLRFVHPEDASFVLENTSQVVLYTPKFWFVLMDLDVPGANNLEGTAIPDILPIPAEAQQDFIRPGDRTLPRSIVSYYPTVSKIVKPNDRVFGSVGVTCPDCIKTRTYWLYFVVGAGGWYSEIVKQPKGLPLLRLMLSTEEVLNEFVPIRKRIPIAGMY